MKTGFRFTSTTQSKKTAIRLNLTFTLHYVIIAILLLHILLHLLTVLQKKVKRRFYFGNWNEMIIENYEEKKSEIQTFFGM